MLSQRVILRALAYGSGGMVSTKSALEATDSQHHLLVSRSELGKVFRPEGSRHTPAQQGLDHLGLQHSRTFRLRGSVVLLFNYVTVVMVPSPSIVEEACF